MSEDAVETKIRQAIGGDPIATSWIVEHADASDDAVVISMAALVQRDAHRLDRARAVAATRRDRQVVAITSAYLDGRIDLVDALARDHLADYPDGLIVAWIASSRPPTPEADN
jgi:hypothetical protein